MWFWGFILRLWRSARDGAHASATAEDEDELEDELEEDEEDEEIHGG